MARSAKKGFIYAVAVTASFILLFPVSADGHSLPGVILHSPVPQQPPQLKHEPQRVPQLPVPTLILRTGESE